MSSTGVCSRSPASRYCLSRSAEPSCSGVARRRVAPRRGRAVRRARTRGRCSGAAPTWTLVGTAGSNGWFKSNVTIRWIVDRQRPASTPVGCQSLSSSRLKDRDVASAQPTSVGWVERHEPDRDDQDRQDGADRRFGARLPEPRTRTDGINHPVAVVVQRAGRDVRAGAAAPVPTYSGGDSASVALSGTCTDNAGNTSHRRASRSSTTRPRRLSRPRVDRPPDAKGWYRKPVTVSFAGTDATSGIATCTGADALRRPGPVDGSGRRVVPRRGRKRG